MLRHILAAAMLLALPAAADAAPLWRHYPPEGAFVAPPPRPLPPPQQAWRSYDPDAALPRIISAVPIAARAAPAAEVVTLPESAPAAALAIPAPTAIAVTPPLVEPPAAVVAEAASADTNASTTTPADVAPITPPVSENTTAVTSPPAATAAPTTPPPAEETAKPTPPAAATATAEIAVAPAPTAAPYQPPAPDVYANLWMKILVVLVAAGGVALFLIGWRKTAGS